MRPDAVRIGCIRLNPDVGCYRDAPNSRWASRGKERLSVCQRLSLSICQNAGQAVVVATVDGTNTA